MKGYTPSQAYELGYALAYRGELLSGSEPIHSTRVGRAAHALWLTVEAVVVGNDAANYPLAASFASGSIAGYEAASAEKLARA